MIETKFKNTELGSIPTDWDVLPIDSLIISMNDGPFGTKLKQEHYTLNREARIIQLSNIGENGWNDVNAKYTTFEYSKELPNHIVNPGDVIVAKMMPAGRAIICPNHEARFVQGSDAIKIKLNDSIDTRYFIYGTKGNGYLNLIEENTQGSTRQRISITKYRKFSFIVPPKVEQLKIAKALSDTDALIKELEVLIDKKRAILQGTMQELLTARRRLPGFSDPWQEVIIPEVCTIHARIGWQGLRSDEFLLHGDYYLVTGTDIKNGLIDWNTAYFVSFERFKQDTHIQLNVGDSLITKDGSIGKVGYVSYLPKKATLNSGVYLVRPKNENNVNAKYLTWFFRSVVFDNFIKELKAGSTISHLYQKDFIKLTIKFPKSIEEQQTIADILSDMDNEISELEAKRDKYLAIRQAMRQQLLTGKIRLI